MDRLEGRTAFITGAASGIGFALAQALLAEGMNVVLADLDDTALAAAGARLDGSNAKVMTVPLDVTDRVQYARVADQVEATLGPVHVVCNNAGVYRGGALDQVTYADWDWIMSVNVGGVVNGVQTWTRRMLEHGEGGHVVNTASMAGMVTSPGLGIYNTSKFAVVGLSEALRQDLAGRGIGVSVLCPGMVRTQILDSERNRPAQFAVDATGALAAAAAHSEIMHMAMQTGIDPAEVADRVVAAIRANEFYVFPHPEMKSAAAARTEELLGAFGEPDPERVAAQAAFMAALLPDGST